MGKYSQTDEAKKNYSSPLLAYMQGIMASDKDHVFTKEELRNALGYSDRMVRHELEHIANYYPVVATSNRKGYRIVLFDDSMSKEDLESIRGEYEHQLNELMSRVNSLYARMKPLIAAKVEVDRAISSK